MTRRFVLARALVVIATIAVVVGQTANPNIGTWKLNPAKSKFGPGIVVKSGTLKIEPAGNGVKLTVDTVTSDGTSRHWEYTTNEDGKNVPVTGNSPYGNTVAVESGS